MSAPGGTARLCFVDPAAPRPYAARSESLAGLGGTEMTLVTLARELARTMVVEVRQRARTKPEIDAGIRFLPFNASERIAAPVLVVINSHKVALKLARTCPGARILLWLHVVPGRHLRKMGPLLRAAGIDVVCVSRSHADLLRGFLHSPLPRLKVAYNMIPDDLLPDNTPRDPGRLFFASAPHKGLREVYAAFAEMRQRIPGLTLEVCDPGYMAWDVGPVPEGVEVLGRLDRREVWGRMRRCLCLFYPQAQFAETFGIVLAEANAVGCPVLAQRGLGANDEVVSGAGQCIDTSRLDLVEARLRQWQATPPRVTGRPEFRASAVARRWQDLLSVHQAAAPAKVPAA